MSWIEKIKEGIKITTGDGEIYEPLYILSSKSIDYNVAEFNFPNVNGTLVKVGNKRGTRHSLRIIFQGEDHLDVSDRFEKSCLDKRPWTISHPFYGQLLVQKTSLQFNPEGLNTMVITGEFIETITDDYPKTSIDPKDFAQQQAIDTASVNAESFSEAELTPSDINELGNDVNDLNDAFGTPDISESAFNEFINDFNDTKTKILDAAEEPLAAANAIVSYISAVARFEVPIAIRLQILLEQFQKLSFGISLLETPTEKKKYETLAGSVFTTMANTAVNPTDSDYKTITEVTSVIDQLVDVNNTYIANLNALQTINGGDINSYVPNFTFANNLSILFNFVLSHLFVIAIDAQQKRVVTLTEDSNVILLAHRYYGLTVDDSTIERFMNQNNIGINEIMNIEKGREIIYYV